MLRVPAIICRNMSFTSQMRMSSDGSQGSAGAIREAGGSFAKMEIAKEDQYFYEQQKEQLKKLREGLQKEISFHEEQIKRHQEAINRHKTAIDNTKNYE